MAQTPRLIDGIVLTKFDTIDDKVREAFRARGVFSNLTLAESFLLVTGGKSCSQQTRAIFSGPLMASPGGCPLC